MKYWADFCLQSDSDDVGFRKVEVISESEITSDMTFVENCAEENIQHIQRNNSTERWYNIYKTPSGKMYAIFDKEIDL